MSTSERSVGFIGLGQKLIDAKLGGLHGSNEVLRYYLEP